MDAGVVCGRRSTMALASPASSLAWGSVPELRTVAARARSSDSLISQALAAGDRVLLARGVVMEVIVERVAALDVHKASVTGCVRVPAAGGGRERIWPSSPRRSGGRWR